MVSGLDVHPIWLLLTLKKKGHDYDVHYHLGKANKRTNILSIKSTVTLISLQVLFNKLSDTRLIRNNKTTFGIHSPTHSL